MVPVCEASDRDPLRAMNLPLHRDPVEPSTVRRVVSVIAANAIRRRVECEPQHMSLAADLESLTG